MKRSLFWIALVLVGLFVMVHEARRAVRHTRQARVDQSWVDRDYPVQSRAPVRLTRDDAGSVVLVPDRDGGAEGAADVYDEDGRAVHREPAEGLPVPVIPGTRTTEARAEAPSATPSPDDRPAATPRSPRWRRGPATATTPRPVAPPTGVRLVPEWTTVTGQLSATEARARDDARRKLERLLADHLTPDVPRSWKVPAELVDGLIRQVIIAPRERDYGTLYQATLKVDLSPVRLAEIRDVYHREAVVTRLIRLGALLAFVLVCLAAVSGYVRTDEATKGYYTNPLRLAAVAGVGAAGVALFRLLA